jgi:hypothetical protein
MFSAEMKHTVRKITSRRFSAEANIHSASARKEITFLFQDTRLSSSRSYKPTIPTFAGCLQALIQFNSLYYYYYSPHMTPLT